MKIVASLTKISRSKLILSLLICNLVVGILLYEFLFYLESEFVENYVLLFGKLFDSMSVYSWIALMIILFPLLETVIFQYLLLLYLKKISDWIFGSHSWTPAFILTSLLFSFAHITNFGINFFGIIQVIVLLFIAFSLSLLSIVEQEKKEDGLPILSVFVLHSSYNFFISIPLFL